MKVQRIANKTDLSEVRCRPVGGTAAFTLPEVLIALVLLGLAGGALFLGLGQGFMFTQENELNMRAEQIVGEKTETVRLYTWSQVTNGNVLATNFTNYFYPTGNTNISQGITYKGTIAVTDPGMSETYDVDLRQVTVTVTWYPTTNWTTGHFKHQLSATTYISKYGMQNYVYGSK